MIFDLSEEPEEEDDTSPPCQTASISNVSEPEINLSQSTESLLHTTPPKTQRTKRKSKSKSPLEISLAAERKAKERAEAKQAKASAREALKQTKAHERMIDLQKHGYYKQKEVSLVLPDELYDAPLGGAVASHLMFATENDKSYGCVSAPSSIPGLCRWTFRNYMDGGNATVGEAGAVVIPFVVVIFNPRVFLELVEATPDGVEFPLLEKEMSELRAQMVEQHGCAEGSKIVLLLIDIDEECKQYNKDQKEAPSGRSDHPVRKESWNDILDEAVAFLLYRESIDVIRRNSDKGKFKEVAQYFETVTRCLGDQAAQQGEKTGLDTIKRIPSKNEAPPERFSSLFSEDMQLQRIFSSMLKVIPRVSHVKAEHLMKSYPFPLLLIEALSDQRVPEIDRKKLLADKLDPNRSNVKLAAQLFKIFTTLDPKEPLL